MTYLEHQGCTMLYELSVPSSSDNSSSHQQLASEYISKLDLSPSRTPELSIPRGNSGVDLNRENNLTGCSAFDKIINSPFSDLKNQIGRDDPCPIEKRSPLFEKAPTNNLWYQKTDRTNVMKNIVPLQSQAPKYHPLPSPRLINRSGFSTPTGSFYNEGLATEKFWSMMASMDNNATDNVYSDRKQEDWNILSLENYFPDKAHRPAFLHQHQHQQQTQPFEQHQLKSPKSLFQIYEPNKIAGLPEITSPQQNLTMNSNASSTSNQMAYLAQAISRIIEANDHQASVELQNMIKKRAFPHFKQIIDLVIKSGLPLYINKFGNFLVQKCFEAADRVQIEKLAGVVDNHFVQIATNQYGCHVVQRILDSPHENLKMIIMANLIQNLNETLCDRYGSHVWQKAFEIKWSPYMPNLIHTLNQVMKGYWSKIAQSETGSLVLQSIFENCILKDKQPCIQEIMADFDENILSQWGNWVIQHLLCQGESQYQTEITQIIVSKAVFYSKNQFASKVIDKGLKKGPQEFKDSYISALLKKSPQTLKVPLIEVASDQYGNYLVQEIINSSDTKQRDQVVEQINKSLVTLRGNRYGQKVVAATLRRSS